MMADGVTPGNSGRGYILRRLLRRAVFQAWKFAPNFSKLFLLTETIIGIYEGVYPELESKKNEIREIFEKEIEKIGIEWGIAFLTTDNLGDWREIILKADFVQLMGIENIGYQGQSFDPRVLDQVKHAREIKPDAIISIDGGVNLETARELALAGANRLVSGSTIFGANAPEVAIEDLKRISNV
jgi:pentose-5-phosphate-3-epimerase